MTLSLSSTVAFLASMAGYGPGGMARSYPAGRPAPASERVEAIFDGAIASNVTLTDHRGRPLLACLFSSASGHGYVAHMRQQDAAQLETGTCYAFQSVVAVFHAPATGPSAKSDTRPVRVIVTAQDGTPLQADVVDLDCSTAPVGEVVEAGRIMVPVL